VSKCLIPGNFGSNPLVFNILASAEAASRLLTPVESR
jgi:hypothetical protein